MALRILAILALLLTVGGVIWFFRKHPGSWNTYKTWFASELKAAFGKEWKQNWKKGVYFLTLVCLVILALTGFIPYLIFGVPLGGFALMLHVALSPLFILLITIIVLGWANSRTFSGQHWNFITSDLFKKEKSQQAADDFFEKFFFWFIVLFSIITASMVFSMYPILGTVGQEAILDVHRFSSVVLFIFFVLHTLRFVRLQSSETVEQK